MCIPIIIDIDITIPAPLELITPVLKAAIKCIDTNQIQYLHLSITRHAVHALKYPQAIIASIQDRFSLRSRASSSSSGKQHFVRHRRGICSPSPSAPSQRQAGRAPRRTPPSMSRSEYRYWRADPSACRQVCRSMCHP